MEHLHVWFVAAAYAIAMVILLADALLPRIKFQSLLRGILLRERRASASKNESPMNPTRQRRLWMALLVLLAAVGGGLIVWALQRNVTFLHSPTAVREGKVPEDARFRLGGVLLEGSVKREPGSLVVAFEVTDRFNNYPVVYDGILPDMFREGTSVIATGRIREGRLVADEVLAKHDEQYMPKEVADAIAAAKEQGEAKAAAAAPAYGEAPRDAATPQADATTSGGND